MSNVVSFPQWRANLARGDKGQTLATLGNITMALRHDEVLRDMLAYDAFTERTVITRPPPIANEGDDPQPGPYPRIWEAQDETLIAAYLQLTLTSSIAVKNVTLAMVAAATARRFHPVIDYLDGLTWDRKPRLDIWLSAAFAAADTPYTRAVAAKVLIAAVRRVRQPGVKFDVMMVLEGKQGLGKSRALKSLFEWFTDRLPRDLDSPDAVRAMLGVWCVELAENDQIIRGGVETIKAFLSRSIDRIVPKYRNEARDIARQCVIIGTTNRDDYLRDVTGNRRFWPILCLAAAVEWIELNRDQLWAEAAYREKSGETLWLDDNLAIEAAQEQSDRIGEDTWDDKIADWLVGRSDVKLADVMTFALSIPIERHERKAQLRAGDCLRRLNWQKGKPGRGGQNKGTVWNKAAVTNGRGDA